MLKNKQVVFVQLNQYIKTYPPVAHIISAVDRFNDRLGSQFGAAITYFSVLSLIPMLMLSFAVTGFF